MAERNITMDILKGFAISAVVIGHVSGDLQPSAMPVYSYHMPLFFFVSGFFFKEEYRQPMLSSIVKICKRVVIPAILITILFIVPFQYLLNIVGILKSNDHFFKAFWNTFVIGRSFLASYWFISVYILSYLYFYTIHVFLYRKFFISSSQVIKKSIFLGIYLTFAILTILYSYTIYSNVDGGDACWKLFHENEIVIYTIRFLFSLFFFYLGSASSTFNVQRVFTLKKSLILLSSIYLVQIYLVKNYETTFSMQIMHFFTPKVALITSINGIFFWYIISNIIQNSPISMIIATIGRYSFSIMSLHFFSFFILNCFFVFTGRISFSDIDTVHYKYSIYYTYSLYFIAGIFLPIAMHKYTMAFIEKTTTYVCGKANICLHR